MIEKWKEWCNQKLSYEGKARKIAFMKKYNRTVCEPSDILSFSR